MIDGKEISAMLPRCFKKSFNSGVIILTKMRFCDESNDKSVRNAIMRLMNVKKLKLM